MAEHDIDKKLEQLKKSNRKSGMLYTLIPMGVIFTVLVVFWTRLEDRDRELDRKEQLLIEREARIASLNNTVGNRDSIIIQISDEIAEDTVGIDTNKNSYKNQIIEQKNIANTTIQQLKEIKSFSKNIKVDYYKQSSDGKKVVNTLEELGLQYDTLPSKIQYNVGPINSIKYGTQVDANSRRILLLHLIKEGFEIRAMEPLGNSQGKENCIVLYRNSYVLNNPVITAEDVSKSPEDY